MPPERPMPYATLHILLNSIEEVMGQNGKLAILKTGKLEKYIDTPPPKTLDLGATFSEYAAAQQAVEDFYGRRGAKAILLRIGRATFQYGLRDNPATLGLKAFVLKALPEKIRVKIILNNIVKALAEKINQPSHLREEADAFYVVFDECPCRWRPNHEKPCGFVAVGSFMEAMAWGTGNVHKVEEVACFSSGSSKGVFRIPKIPTG